MDAEDLEDSAEHVGRYQGPGLTDLLGDPRGDGRESKRD
jgi:hypothetical protein